MNACSYVMHNVCNVVLGRKSVSQKEPELGKEDRNAKKPLAFRALNFGS